MVLRTEESLLWPQTQLIHSYWASPWQAVGGKVYLPGHTEAVSGRRLLDLTLSLQPSGGRVCRKDKTAPVALKEAYRVEQGTIYASMTWSPSALPHLLPRQGTLTYSQPWPHGEHLTGFEETSRWNPSSTLLIWLYVLSISRSLSLQNHQNPRILCVDILYCISTRSSNPSCIFFRFFCH